MFYLRLMEGKEPYTYDKYLEVWMECFGKGETGVFPCWQSGTITERALPKMSEAEFAVTLAQYNVLQRMIDELEARPGYPNDPILYFKAWHLIARSFKCELPLFF